MKETENSNKGKWLKIGLKVFAYLVLFFHIMFLSISNDDLAERNEKLSDCKCEKLKDLNKDDMKKERGVKNDKTK